MCRCLYTLQHGSIVTKAIAARWAQRELGAQRAGLVERALAWPRGGQVEDLGETLDLIRYTLERAQRCQASKDQA
jgi:hypothetical protein